MSAVVLLNVQHEGLLQQSLDMVLVEVLEKCTRAGMLVTICPCLLAIQNDGAPVDLVGVGAVTSQLGKKET